MSKNTPRRDPVQVILGRLKGVKQTGKDQWEAFCPCHEDPPDGHKRSLSVKKGRDGRALVHCHGGCPLDDVLAAIGSKQADLFPGRSPKPPQPRQRKASGQARRRMVEAYSYCDAKGNLLFQSVRYDPKDFHFRRPDGKGGWIWNLKGVLRILYRLPELLAADPSAWVFVPEGEKDVDALRGVGLVATCNPGGKMKWKRLSGFSALHRRRVAIIPDNDADGGGLLHAQDVAARLCAKAADVRIVELPGHVKDVSDWLDTLDAKEPQDLATALVNMAEAAGVWTPEANTRSPVEAFRPFPVDALPEPVRGFVSVGAKALGCDASYIALPLLSALASAVGNARRIRLKRAWTEPAIVWTAIVGESGTMKSPAMELALRPVRTRQIRAFKAYAAAMEEYEAATIRYENDLAQWKRHKDAGDPPRKPEEPVADRCWCDDVTIEALAVLLRENWRGLLLVRDELAGWLGSFDRYAKGKGGDVAKWLEMHGGRSIVVDRKTTERKVIHVPRAAVSIAGGIQPGTLERALGRAHFEDGLAPRLLLACPPRRVKRWSEVDIPREVEERLEVIFEKLYALQPATDEEGDPCPVTLRLTAKGKQGWVEFFNAHAEEQVELTGDLSAAWSKLEGYAARLALVVHLVRWAADDHTLESPEDVDGASIAAGVGLSTWFKQEARRVYAMLGESEEDRQRRGLVELIRRKGGAVTVREVMRSGGEYRTAAQTEAALEELVKAGLGRWEELPAGEKGGRPTRRLRLVDDADTDKTPPIS